MADDRLAGFAVGDAVFVSPAMIAPSRQRCPAAFALGMDHADDDERR